MGGTKEPLFVIATDVKTNTVFVGEGKKHAGLFRKALFVATADIHWVRDDMALKTGEKMEVTTRIRYRQPLQKAFLYRAENGLFVVFDALQAAITSGQFVAWYLEDELIGSGIIS